MASVACRAGRHMHQRSLFDLLSAPFFCMLFNPTFFLSLFADHRQTFSSGACRAQEKALWWRCRNRRQQRARLRWRFVDDATNTGTSSAETTLTFLARFLCLKQPCTHGSGEGNCSNIKATALDEVIDEVVHCRHCPVAAAKQVRS